MGDVKLALLLGAMLGRNVTVALMVGLFAALVPAWSSRSVTEPEGTEDRDPVRAVSRVRGRHRAVLRKRDPGLVSRDLRVAATRSPSLQAPRAITGGSNRHRLQV